MKYGVTILTKEAEETLLKELDKFGLHWSGGKTALEFKPLKDLGVSEAYIVFDDKQVYHGRKGPGDVVDLGIFARDSSIRKMMDGGFVQVFQSDSAVKPSHYQSGNVDVIEALYQMMPLDQFRGFMKGNVVKYITRYENKNGVEDLKKATEYVRRLQEYEKA